jgi:3-phenylpropionate/trans-cinnamate dioxygenase ferredoxin component
MAMTKSDIDVFRWLGPADALHDETVLPYYLEDRKQRVSLARVNGRLYAFDDLCTCSEQACPLSGGLLVGTTIMCQCHGSCFDLTTGAVLAGPAAAALKVYEAQEMDGTVGIRLDTLIA